MKIGDTVRVTVDNDKVIKFIDSVDKEYENCAYKFIAGVVIHINDGSFVVSFNHYIDNDVFEYKQLQNKSESIEISNDSEYGYVTVTEFQLLLHQATTVIEDYYFYSYEYQMIDLTKIKGNGIWKTRSKVVLMIYNDINKRLQEENGSNVITAFNKI